MLLNPNSTLVGNQFSSLCDIIIVHCTALLCYDQASTIYRPVASKRFMYCCASAADKPPWPCSTRSLNALATSWGIFWADPQVYTCAPCIALHGCMRFTPYACQYRRKGAE